MQLLLQCHTRSLSLGHNNNNTKVKGQTLVINVLVPGEHLLLVLLCIILMQLRSLTIQRTRIVWLPQQTLQAQQHALDVVDGAPLVLEDVKADAAAEVNVGVVDGGLEEDCWWRVGVVGGEGEGELEREAGVGCFGRTADGGGPVHEVAVGVREGGDAGRGGEHEGHEFGLEAVWLSV